MTTLRVNRRNRFTTIDQRTINDDRLSFRARGVLAWLLDKPDDWRCDSETIAAAGVEGRGAVRAALTELESQGYLRRTKVQDRETGHWATVVDVFERPTTEATQSVVTEDRFPVVGQPAVGQPAVGQPNVGGPVAKRPSTKTKDLDQTSSSSSGSNARCADGAEEEATLTADTATEAARLHADRAFKNRIGDPVTDASAWKAKARARWLAENAEEAAVILMEQPELDAKALLRKIDDPGYGDGLGYTLSGAPDLPVIDEDDKAATKALRDAMRDAIPTARKREAS